MTFPHHRQQSGQVGCLYHSSFALLGDPDLLTHVEDTSAARFYVRLAELGLMAFVLWCTDPPFDPAPASFWEGLRSRFTRDNTEDAQIERERAAGISPTLKAAPPTTPPQEVVTA